MTWPPAGGRLLADASAAKFGGLLLLCTMAVYLTQTRVASGVIVMWAGDGLQVPAGWLLCNGEPVSRTGTTAALWAAVGATYGAGNGSSTFNLPDLRSCIPVGVGAGSRLGAKGGTNSVTLTASNLPSHTHGGSVTAAGDHTHPNNLTNSTGGHTHQAAAAEGRNGGYAAWNIYWSGTGGQLWWEDGGLIGTSQSAGSHTHTFGNSDTQGAHKHAITTGQGPGTSQALDVTNPYLSLHFIIKV